LESVTAEIPKFYARVREVDVGEIFQRPPLDETGSIPSFVWIIEKTFEARA